MTRLLGRTAAPVEQATMHIEGMPSGVTRRVESDSAGATIPSALG